MPFLSEPDNSKEQSFQSNPQAYHQSNEDGDANAEPSNEPMPIAIVGMSCRLPGDATDPEQLWNMISEGRSAWSEIPADRFNVEAFYHPSGDRQGTVGLIPKSHGAFHTVTRTNHSQINVRGGHFLKNDIAAFDALFFTITLNEARAMDP